MNDLFALASDATISPCGLYRYSLRRQIRPASDQTCLFIMLNPSTADAKADDPTVRRCIRFASDWGYNWLTVVNLFALRATDPQSLTNAADPIGPNNDAWILDRVNAADLVVCAWGKHGALMDRAKAVLELLAWRDLHCLALNRDGSPKHPLYVASATKPQPFGMVAA